MGSPWPRDGLQEVKATTPSDSSVADTGDGYTACGAVGAAGANVRQVSQFAHVIPSYFDFQQNQHIYNPVHYPPIQPEAPQHGLIQNLQQQQVMMLRPLSPLAVVVEGRNEDIFRQSGNGQPDQTYFTFEVAQDNNNNHISNYQQFPPVGDIFPSVFSSPSMSNSSASPFLSPAPASPFPSPSASSTSLSPTVTSTTGTLIPRSLFPHVSVPLEQSPFVNCVRGIPTWERYYTDQKHRLSDFADANNRIRPDSQINQRVSLSFLDTCITTLAVDAIVNSTTEDYSGISGVDKMIHQQAGSSLREACKTLPALLPGQATMTLGFQLPAKYIIHTNGPLTEVGAAEQLTGCYTNSFDLFLMNRLRTIAFPCISSGGKTLSKTLAAEIALSTVRQMLEVHKHSVDRVIFCLHHQKNIEIYLRYMQIYFPVVGTTAAIG